MSDSLIAHRSNDEKYPTLKINKNIDEISIKGYYYLFNRDRGRLYQVNESGMIAWECMKQGISLWEIMDSMSASASNLRRQGWYEIEVFIQRLIDEGFLFMTDDL